MSRRPWFVVPTLGGKQLWGDVFLQAGYRIQRQVGTGRHRLLDPRDLRLCGGTYEACYARFDGLREHQGFAPQSDHLVLLLHGIFRSKDSFAPMTRALRAAGYEAHAVNYPSTRQSLEDHAEQVEAILERVEGVRRLSLVTHSMGGIVARVLLARTEAPWRARIEVCRVLMIATPNRGAEIAERLRQISPFAAVAGPSLAQLEPDRSSELPPLNVPFAIVAGGTGNERGFNPLLQGDNDMTVTVDETHLEGAEDFLRVPVVHTFIMSNPIVVHAAVRYLATGRLTDAAAEAASS